MRHSKTDSHDQAGSRGIESAEIVARIVEYEQSLSVGHTLEFQSHNSVQQFPDELQTRLLGIFECLEWIDRARRAHVPAREGTPDMPPGGGNPSGLSKTDNQSVLLTIGRFSVLRELGRGGHGVVFLANDPVLRRQVALKVPRPEFLLSMPMVRRFLAEARAAASLDHPNILKLFEVGRDGAICYIAQELCRGPSLADWLSQQVAAVEPRMAAKIVMDLARGVEQAHLQGILHRDLKPANVLLQPVAGTEQFTPKLADFGIAKIIDGESDATATLTGTAIGTIAYMSPEQAAGRVAEIGSASDVYGLGAILYELLTGRPPFEVRSGSGVMETLQRVVNSHPLAPRAVRNEIPAACEAICLHCLQKSPTDRYTKASELAADLERFLNGKPVSVWPTRRRWHRLLRLARWRSGAVRIGMAAVALLVATCFAIIGLRSSGIRPAKSMESVYSPQEEHVNGLDRQSQNNFRAVPYRGDEKKSVRGLDSLSWHKAKIHTALSLGMESWWSPPARTILRISGMRKLATSMAMLVVQ